ncbi:MAG: antirestriction protein ArdA [Devosiaceae bacterium]|nr:antirestriction protein ArdA [Devosiaceae bacterium]
MPELNEQIETYNSTILEPRIYVACLAAYNNGYLHGKWISATQDESQIHKEILQMLEQSPISNAEEWAIHDYEGFEGAELFEYSSIENVVAFVEFINEHGQLGGELLNHFNNNIDDANNALENHAGEYKSLADFAQELTEQSTKIPQNLAYYIDYEAMAKDMQMSGDVFTIELSFEQSHVFWAH